MALVGEGARFPAGTTMTFDAVDMSESDGSGFRVDVGS